nr:RNA-directed DNA polymerase, eukaryota, nucleotide-binding alpha-beta plait domain protein [Tanacetum cinerariifolium]
STPAIILNDLCIKERDFSCSLMGKIKDINAISNLYNILANEGFDTVKLSYLGGYWVLLDMESVSSNEKLSSHVAWMPEFSIAEEEDSSTGEEYENNNGNDFGFVNEHEFDHVFEISFVHENEAENMKNLNSSGKNVN